MIDVEGGDNPLVKDLVVNGRGQIFVLMTFETQVGNKVTSLVRYSQCGILEEKSDLEDGTFVSRDAYLATDGSNAILAGNELGSEENYFCLF